MRWRRGALFGPFVLCAILGPLVVLGLTLGRPGATGTSYRSTHPPHTAPPSPEVTPPTVPAAAATTTSVPTVAPQVYAAWSRVATCEEGGWVGAAGPAYPDSLGISARNWTAYGGGADLSPAAQILVAERIEAAGGDPGYLPDQYGCAPW